MHRARRRFAPAAAAREADSVLKVNGRSYAPPVQPTVVIGVDGCEPDYIAPAVAVFLNGDLKSAQLLIDEKVDFRELEMRYADTHLQRLSGNTPQSIETSSLHLDLLSDFKRVNSLFCSVAYPILESAGVLSKTRVLPASANGRSNSPPAQGSAHAH